MVRDDGLWQNSSVQSMMHRVDGYAFLKVSGIISWICCMDGHIFLSPREKCIKFAQVIIYLETVAFGVSNSQAAKGNVKPHFSHVINKNSCWIAFNFVLHPLLQPVLGALPSAEAGSFSRFVNFNVLAEFSWH